MQKIPNEFKTISLILESSFVEICKSFLLPLIPNGVLVKGRVDLSSEKTDLCSLNFNHFVTIPHDFKNFDDQKKLLVFPPKNSHIKDSKNINFLNEDTFTISNKDKEILSSDKLDNIRCCACRDNDYEWEGGDDDDDKVSIVVDDGPTDNFIAANLCVESEDNSFTMLSEGILKHNHFTQTQNNLINGCLPEEGGSSGKVHKKKIPIIKNNKSRRKKSSEHCNKKIKSSISKPEDDKRLHSAKDSNKLSLNHLSNISEDEKEIDLKTLMEKNSRLNKTEHIKRIRTIPSNHTQPLSAISLIKNNDNITNNKREISNIGNEIYDNSKNNNNNQNTINNNNNINNQNNINNNNNINNQNTINNNNNINNNTNINNNNTIININKKTSNHHHTTPQLNKHAAMRFHRHVCNICGLKFTFRTNLTRHIKNIHSSTPPSSTNHLVSL